MSTRLQQLLASFSQDKYKNAIHGIRRGLEREALRINANGTLSQLSHPPSLGSTLTHKYITTDYAESLLEFITPAEKDPQLTLNQLSDVHKHVLSHIGDERLWSMSMPCYIGDESEIQIADYGTSNVGQMKRLYRKGLKHRYGSMMQAIAGVHFNLSFPESLWDALAEIHQVDISTPALRQAFISEQYLALIRNFKRLVWLLTYFYGASPTICSSFLQGKSHQLPFERLETGTLYLPYATSLRMSDLGYTNHEQSSLGVTYNNLDEYVSSLRRAIKTQSESYKSIGVKVDGEYRQLNDNILQIENEFYSPVRPKRTTLSGEKPTDALAARGIEYVEIRALDVNPFSPVGVSLEQMRFLDIFLTYCLFADSPTMSVEQQNETEANLNEVIVRGRESGLPLMVNEQSVSAYDWANEVLEDMKALASWFDAVYETNDYSESIALAKARVESPDLTFSGRLLAIMKQQNVGETPWSLAQADAYKAQLLADDYHVFDEALFTSLAKASVNEREAMEANDAVNFDVFLADYFAS